MSYEVNETEFNALLRLHGEVYVREHDPRVHQGKNVTQFKVALEKLMDAHGVRRVNLEVERDPESTRDMVYSS